LTEETTCATVLSKKTPYEKNCQKRSLLGGGMSGQVPCQLAGFSPGGKAHSGGESQLAGFGGGGRCMPALAQAASDTCRLPRHAATKGWSFLTIFLAGGLF
jgi:hypothetical protein